MISVIVGIDSRDEHAAATELGDATFRVVVAHGFKSLHQLSTLLRSGERSNVRMGEFMIDVHDFPWLCERRECGDRNGEFYQFCDRDIEDVL